MQYDHKETGIFKRNRVLKETGGLSGKAVRPFTDEVLQWVKAEKSFTIIAVGGILDPEDGINKVKQGADLIQIYSGMIYKGPWMVRKLKKVCLRDNNPQIICFSFI